MSEKLPEIYECPSCGWRLSSIEYFSLRVDIKCPNCGVCNVSQFVELDDEDRSDSDEVQ